MIDNVRDTQLKNSRIPDNYLKSIKMEFRKDDDKAYAQLQEICNKVVEFVHGGYHLLLQSAIPGNGKTTFACKIAKKYVDDYASNYDNMTPVVFVNVPKYIAMKKKCVDDKTKVKDLYALEDDILKADIVIWDDIAAKTMSAYDMDILYVSINDRYSEGKTNIFTSNCSPDDMEAVLGARLASRVLNASTTITFVAPDYRKSAHIWGGTNV